MFPQQCFLVCSGLLNAMAMTLVNLCECSLSQSVFATYDFFSQSAEVGCEVQRIMGAIILCSTRTLVEARAGVCLASHLAGQAH